MGSRLREIRHKCGLSLRDFADWIETATGFETSYESIRQYEQGQRAVPGAYLAAMTTACAVRSEWVLLGQGGMTSDVSDGVDTSSRAAEIFAEVADIETITEKTREAWISFMSRETSGVGPRKVIFESWARSKRNSVDPLKQSPCVPKVSAQELEDRIQANQQLIDVAVPHLRWVSRMLSPTAHVVYLTDTEGIVLWSCAQNEALIAQWELEEGFDWSEKSMGTNGAGTALATGEVVAVIGAEHYVKSIQDCVCVGAPIFDAKGTICGAIDLSTTLRETDPRRVMTIAYVAAMIRQDLRKAG